MTHWNSIAEFTTLGKQIRTIIPPPWKRSRPGWMGLWATWSSARCPWPWQGGWN